MYFARGGVSALKLVANFAFSARRALAATRAEEQFLLNLLFRGARLRTQEFGQRPSARDRRRSCLRFLRSAPPGEPSLAGRSVQTSPLFPNFSYYQSQYKCEFETVRVYRSRCSRFLNLIDRESRVWTSAGIERGATVSWIHTIVSGVELIDLSHRIQRIREVL